MQSGVRETWVSGPKLYWLLYKSVGFISTALARLTIKISLPSHAVLLSVLVVK